LYICGVNEESDGQQIQYAEKQYKEEEQGEVKKGWHFLLVREGIITSQAAQD
jgi:hypothetical protein